MSILNLIIGLLLVPLGILIIIEYEKIRSRFKFEGISFKLRTFGIGLVILGIYLVVKELSSLI